MSTDDLDMANAEFITPPDEWRKKVRVMGKREASKFDPVKAAEAALARLAKNFPDWMAGEAQTLNLTYDAIAENGLSKESLDALYQSAHNIKGQALTLGYPLVGSVAGNLCHLIETVPTAHDIPLPLLAQHVRAIRAMVSENARDEDNATGAELLASLQGLTDDLLAKFPDTPAD